VDKVAPDGKVDRDNLIKALQALYPGRTFIRTSVASVLGRMHARGALYLVEKGNKMGCTVYRKPKVQPKS
jgi:hypothetical protein